MDKATATKVQLKLFQMKRELRKWLHEQGIFPKEVDLPIEIHIGWVSKSTDVDPCANGCSELLTMSIEEFFTSERMSSVGVDVGFRSRIKHLTDPSKYKKEKVDDDVPHIALVADLYKVGARRIVRYHQVQGSTLNAMNLVLLASGLAEIE
jgi:hypothetical protein